MAEARQRIKYKFARPYMNEEPTSEEGLREEVNRIIAEELDEETRRVLKQDINREIGNIRFYHEHTEMPSE